MALFTYQKGESGPHVKFTAQDGDILSPEEVLAWSALRIAGSLEALEIKAQQIDLELGRIAQALS